MPGFLGLINKKYNDIFNDCNNQDLIIDNINENEYYLERRTIKKFMNDKLFLDTERYIIITEGIILNKKVLIRRYQADIFQDLIIKMYKKNGDEFFSEFRGSFSGLFYDKKKDKWLIYTNFIGDKQIFYYKNDDSIVFGSEINYILEYLNNNNFNYNLDQNGAYFLLTYGYMLEDYTLFKEIKKLNAGHYIKIENQNFEIKQYYKLDNTPNFNQTEDEIIENIDHLFRKAIELEFEKDKEYGYKHIAGLSGGLDSRMTTWVAHDMGYKDMLNFTFSQSNYLDETIAKKIAADLKHGFLFKALDNGLFLKDLENTVAISNGGALYYGLAHGRSLLSLINFKDYGVIHTGQVGDVVIGTFYSSLDKRKFKHGDGAYSNILYNKIKEIELKYEYENEEIFKFYNRGFTGALQGNVMMQEYSEVASPFLNREFLEYCLKIPVENRLNHNIYKKWIKKKYLEASNYKWEKLNAKITHPTVNIFGRDIPLKKLPKKIIDKLLNEIGFDRSRLNSKKSMNPLDYWYNNNQELKEFMDNYFKENIDRLDSNKELKDDCIYLYNNGKTVEKTQVLTLLSTLKLFF